MLKHYPGYAATLLEAGGAKTFSFVLCPVGRLQLGHLVHSLPGAKEDLRTHVGLALPPSIGIVVWCDELFLWRPCAMVTVGAPALRP